MKQLLFAAAVLAASLVAAAAATADNDKKDGFKTAAPSMLIGVAPGSTTEVIISTGGMVGGYRFESIPDGIALRRHDKNRVEAYVNHETSLVPFPFPMPPRRRRVDLEERLQEAQVSLLTMSRETAGSQGGSSSTARELPSFCSSSWRRRGPASTTRSCYERGRDRLGGAHGKAWPTTVGAATRARSARSSRTTCGSGERGRSGGGPAERPEQPRRAGLRTSRRALRRRLVREQPGSVVGLPVHRRQRERRHERTGRALRLRLGHARKGRRLRLRPRRSESATGHFSWSRRTSRPTKPDGTDLIRPTRVTRCRSHPLRAWAGSATRSPASRSTGRSGCSALGRRTHRGRAGDPVRSHRGHGVRQAAGHGERRLPRRLGPRTTGASQPGRSTNGRVWKMVLDKSDRRGPLAVDLHRR